MAHILIGRALSRRTFLRGVGAAIALPWLDAMLPALCRADRSARLAPPLRSVFLFTPNGKKMDEWTPGEKGAGFRLPALLEPLAPYRSDFSVLSGLALDGARAHGDGPGDHARSSAAFLTASHPKKTGGSDIQCAISVDQVIAQKIGQETLLPSLELGGEGGKLAGVCDSGYSCAYVNSISWRSATQPLAKETNPREVFSRLFGDFESAQNRQGEAKRRSLRRSILDAVHDDADRLRANLGAADKRKLDEYLAAVRELEARLQKMEKEQRTVEIPKGLLSTGGVDGYAERLEQMIDLIALAFQGDLVRVVTFALANDGSNRSYPNLGVADGHHDMSHHGKDPQKLVKVKKINLFHVGMLARLLGRLKEAKDGDGNLLDQSVVLYGSGISDGDKHNHDDLPILLAGHAQKKLKQGRHLVFPKNTPLGGLHLNILKWNGIDAPSFGDAKQPIALS